MKLFTQWLSPVLAHLGLALQALRRRLSLGTARHTPHWTPVPIPANRDRRLVVRRLPYRPD